MLNLEQIIVIALGIFVGYLLVYTSKIVGNVITQIIMECAYGHERTYGIIINGSLLRPEIVELINIKNELIEIRKRQNDITVLIQNLK